MAGKDNITRELATRTVAELLRRAGVGGRIADDREAAAVLAGLHGSIRKMTAWHGSATSFDKFNWQGHAGEGEGSQVFGQGNYLSDQRSLSMKYARIAFMNSPERQADIDGRIVNWNDPKESTMAEYIACDYIERFGPEEAKKEIRASIELNEKARKTPNGWVFDKDADDLAAARELIDGNRIRILQKSHRPLLYKVEIPDDTGTNYLSWDGMVSVSEQKNIYGLLALYCDDMLKDRPGDLEYYKKSVRDEILSLGSKDVTGGELYKSVCLYIGEKDASKFLSGAGYVGMKVHASYFAGDPRYNANWNYVIFNDNDIRIKEKIRLQQDSGGKLMGWQEGNSIVLTRDGINPETPIHEYTHLWARAMMVKNPEGWKNVKDLLRDTPVWNEVVSDRNYTNIIPNDDYIASEALARATGRDRGQQLNYEARNQLLFGKTGGREETAKGLLARMDNAIHRFWTWVGKELFGIKKFDSIDDVTARVMHDLMKGTDVRLNEGDFMLYQPIAKQEVYHNNISPKGIIKMAEGQERKRQGFSEALDDGSRLDLAGLTLNPLSKDLAHTPYGDKVVYEDDRHLITSAQIYADGNDRHGIEQADTTTNVFRKIPGGEFFRRFDREYGGQPDREGRLRLLSMSDDVKKVLSARRGSFQKAFSMEAEKRGKDGFLETGEVRIKVGDRDITVNDELLGAYTEGNVNEQEAMAVITAAKADPNIRKILELSFKIDKDMENNKQRTADIGETAEAAGGRWHQQEQNESRVWGIYGQHIADYIKSYSGWLRLEKQHYSYSGHSVRDLMRTLVTENRNFSTPNFYDSEYLRKNGLKVKDGEKPLPVLYESGGKMEIREEYNFDQIEGGTGGTDLAKEAGEQHFLPAEGIEDIVRESRWPVPIKTEYTPDGPTALMTAWFDKDNNNILVRPKEKEDIPDPARKALILEMMGYSLFETGRVKENYKNENHFDGYSAMQRLMGFISFGIDFGQNQKDEQEYESKFLFMGDMEKMKAWSQKNADRFANDPDYTRDVLTKAAIVSKFIEDRARGIAYSQDEQIDDDVDASMEGRKKEDLLSENGDGLDPDGDGVTNIIQDLVGDSNGEEESEKRQDETRQHRHEETHLRR